jgi:hypothetical protein
MNVFKQMIRHLETGSNIHPIVDVLSNLDLTGMLDAALKSVRSGGIELIHNQHWEI